MGYRSRLGAFGFALYALAVVASAAAPIKPEKEFALTILHTNDVHGHLAPFAYVEAGRGKNERPSVGGAARRATLIRNLRRSIQNPTLLLDAGDVVTRGPLATTYEGKPDIDVMNAIGYDAACLGNNEFKLKDGSLAQDAKGAQEGLLRVVRRSRFPWVCANALDSNGAWLTGVKPFVVRKVGAVRVGILGLTAPRSANYPQTKGWGIGDPFKAAKEWIPKARQECDVLIALTHIGDIFDRGLAATTTGIDAIVGGDSHTFLYKPVLAKNAKGQTVPIVQTGEFGANVGRLDLRFVKDGDGWRLASATGELLAVGPETREAADVVSLLRPYLAPFQKVVGKAPGLGNTPEVALAETARIYANGARMAAAADAGLQPTDDGIFGPFRKAEVTRYDVYDIWPFANVVAVAEISGDELKAAMEKPTNVVVGLAGPVQSGRTYRVAMANYIALSVLKLPADRVKVTTIDFRDAAIRYLQSVRTVRVGPRVQTVRGARHAAGTPLAAAGKPVAR